VPREAPRDQAAMLDSHPVPRPRLPRLALRREAHHRLATAPHRHPLEPCITPRWVASRQLRARMAQATQLPPPATPPEHPPLPATPPAPLLRDMVHLLLDMVPRLQDMVHLLRDMVPAHRPQDTVTLHQALLGTFSAMLVYGGVCEAVLCCGELRCVVSWDCDIWGLCFSHASNSYGAGYPQPGGYPGGPRPAVVVVGGGKMKGHHKYKHKGYKFKHPKMKFKHKFKKFKFK